MPAPGSESPDRFGRIERRLRRLEIVALRSRRIGKASPRLNVTPVAAEIAELILAGRDDPRLTWRADRLAVKLNTSMVLPSAKRQTQEGRVKRLHAALEAALSGGYARSGVWYRKTPVR
jgi:hypothetical protein